MYTTDPAAREKGHRHILFVGRSKVCYNPA
jgi:hypothetical protein